MRAVIKLDVPEFQIGQEVTVYFKDTMQTRGVCEKDRIVLCKDCVHAQRMVELVGKLPAS